MKNIHNSCCRYFKNCILITLYIYDINTKLIWLPSYDSRAKIAENRRKSPKIAKNYHIFSFFGCPGVFFTPIELGMVSYISAKVHHHKNPSLSLIQEKRSF